MTASTPSSISSGMVSVPVRSSGQCSTRHPLASSQDRFRIDRDVARTGRPSAIAEASRWLPNSPLAPVTSVYIRPLNKNDSLQALRYSLDRPTVKARRPRPIAGVHRQPSFRRRADRVDCEAADTMEAPAVGKRSTAASQRRTRPARPFVIATSTSNALLQPADPARSRVKPETECIA